MGRVRVNVFSCIALRFLDSGTVGKGGLECPGSWLCGGKGGDLDCLCDVVHSFS